MEDSFDWELCIICQKNSKEKLQCPANEGHLRPDIGSGYVTLANNLREVSLLGVVTPLTKSFGINNLDRILYCNKGKWHKSCNLKYNTSTLNRSQKRKNDSSILDSDTLSKSSDPRRKSLKCEVTSNV